MKQNYLWSFVSCGGMVQQGFTTGIGVPVWDGPLWHKPSWQSPLTIQPVNLKSGSPQAKKTTRKEPQSHLSSVAQSCPTLCDPTDCSKPGFPVQHQTRSTLKLISIELVMPSSHLILCHPLLLLPSIFPSIRVFFSESVLHMR